jgi:hypothetical protein
MRPYLNIDQLINMIDEPNRAPAQRLLADNRELFSKAKGALYNHHWWDGGYLDHVTDAMNTSLALYETLDALRPLPFSASDALLVLWLHDLEKPWKYEIRDGNLEFIAGLDTREKIKEFVKGRVAEYGFQLTPAHQNGIEYIETEFFNYSPRERRQGPLAAFAHLADTWSARGWYDFPKEGDPWSGR